MKRLALLLMTTSSCFACRSSTPPTIQTPSETIYDVTWVTLIRDYQTANAYKNLRVRIRLNSTDYEIRGTEIHIWAGSKSAPPVIVCKVAAVGDKLRDVVLVGLCRGPVRDNVWRSPRTDFGIVIEDCLVTVR